MNTPQTVILQGDIHNTYIYVYIHGKVAHYYPYYNTLFVIVIQPIVHLKLLNLTRN